jgi:ligand-binding sensor protein
MKLTDILPLEEWRQLENEIFERSGLNPTIYDDEGVNITGTATKNDLCRLIKSNPNGREHICGSSLDVLTKEAKRTCRPVLGTCRSGQKKIVVPIFVGVTFLGVAGGCGLLPEKGEIDLSFVGRTLSMDEDRVEGLAAKIPRIDAKTADDVAEYIRDRIDGIVSIYLVMQNGRNPVMQ